MEMKFSRELDGSYMIIEETEPGDAFTINMLQAEEPEHLLHLQVKQVENGKEFCYEISGMKSLAGLLAKREMQGKEIKELLRAIYQVSAELEEYLLEPDRLWLEPELIFRAKDGWCFCLHPARKQEFYQQLQVLSRYILKKASHEEEDTMNMAYELFRVCHEDNYCFAQIWEVLEEKRESDNLSPSQIREAEPESVSAGKKRGFSLFGRRRK